MSEMKFDEVTQGWNRLSVDDITYLDYYFFQLHARYMITAEAETMVSGKMG